MGASIAFTVTVMLLIFAIVQKIRSCKIKRKEELALKGIVAGIGNRLHATYPNTKWRWVCCPVGFATTGGIARIEVLDQSGNVSFMDVCLSTNGYMALHVLNVVELVTTDMGSDTGLDEDVNSTLVDLEDTKESSPSVASSKSGTKPYDEETVIKWYNIMLIGALTTLIDNLNADGEVCIHISQDGKAYIEEDGNNSVVYDFGAMPDVSLWNHIIDKLSEEGLFAEIQEENCIFISWA